MLMMLLLLTWCCCRRLSLLELQCAPAHTRAASSFDSSVGADAASVVAEDAAAPLSALGGPRVSRHGHPAPQPALVLFPNLHHVSLPPPPPPPSSSSSSSAAVHDELPSTPHHLASLSKCERTPARAQPASPRSPAGIRCLCRASTNQASSCCSSSPPLPNSLSPIE